MRAVKDMVEDLVEMSHACNPSFVFLLAAIWHIISMLGILLPLFHCVSLYCCLCMLVLPAESYGPTENSNRASYEATCLLCSWTHSGTATTPN